MATLTQPLRDEHKELIPHIERLRTVADPVGEAPIESLRQGVDEIYTFLIHHLIPHAQAEDQVLYPVVGKVLGAPEATATMSRDHVEVGRLTEEGDSVRVNRPVFFKTVEITAEVMANEGHYDHRYCRLEGTTTALGSHVR